MIFNRLAKEVTYHMDVIDGDVEKQYTRMPEGHWCEMVSYDIHFEYEQVNAELGAKLEELFQSYPYH